MDTTSLINTCTPSVMALFPKRNKVIIKKPILTFNGEITVNKNDAYESLLEIDIPNLSTGHFNFVKSPISTRGRSLGLLWLEMVNHDVN